MQQELRDQYHCKQAGPGKAARNGMRRCRRLADRFTIPAGEFFPHMLDNLPAAWFTFKRFGDGLAELVKP